MTPIQKLLKDLENNQTHETQAGKKMYSNISEEELVALVSRTVEYCTQKIEAAVKSADHDFEVTGLVKDTTQKLKNKLVVPAKIKPKYSRP